jgi:hypothetical protein
MNERFTLAKADRVSSTWIALKKHLEQRLEVLRAQNDGDLNPEKTAKTRGQIAEVKRILSLDKDLPHIES